LRVSPWEVKLRERVLGLMGKKRKKIAPFLLLLLPFTPYPFTFSTEKETQ